MTKTTTNLRKFFACTLLGVFALALWGAAPALAAPGQVTIGGKEFTEQVLMVELMRALVEDKTDLKVVSKPHLGGTQIVDQALQRGDLDIYVEYTGTALLSILKEPTMNDPKAVYDKVAKIYREKRKIAWLDPLGFNNTYALAMRADHAKELGIKTISDLAKHAPKLVLGATQEFLERPDGYRELRKAYMGLDFKERRGMDPGLTYLACQSGKVDVITAFATDGRIVAFNLLVIEDDKRFFPPYDAAPLVRMDTLEKHPELKAALNTLAGKIDDKTMSKLNAQVDLDKKKAEDVARNWLMENGYIKKK